MNDDDPSEDGRRKLKLALEVCYTVYAGMILPLVSGC